MSPRSTISPLRIIVAGTIALAIWAPAAAMKFEWSEAEVRCAKKAGIDLNADADPGSAGYVKRLAWLSDLIVYGTVAEIRSDPRSAYPTNVRIKVLSVKKGRLSGGRVTVALLSGPRYSSEHDKIVEAQVGDEPSFAKGQTVLLFLTKDAMDSTGPLPFALPKDSFGLVDDARFLVDGPTATLQGPGDGDYKVVTSDDQIRQVVAAQAATCR